MKYFNHFRTLIVVALAFASAAGVQANNSPTNLFGIDVSSAQGHINWSTVASNGVSFAFVKATEGTSVTDLDYAGNMKRGKNNGLLMGAYHSADPSLSCSSVQANKFWSVAGGDIVSDGQSLYPAVDFEVLAGVACAETSYTTWFNRYYKDVWDKSAIQLFMQIIVTPCNRCSLGNDLWLQSFLINEDGQNLYTGNPWDICCPCPATTSGTCDSNAWAYWRAAVGSVGGVNNPCNLDAYNGTLSDLKGWQLVGGQ